MATTAYPLGHPLAQRIWAKKLLQEALKETYISRFIGGADAIITKKTELSKDAGDRLTVGLRVQMSGAGVSGDNTLEGNEEALVTYTDDLYLDQLRHAARSSGKMSEQRVPFDVREEAKNGLRDWFADRMDTAFFNQIGGNSTQTDTRYTGGNATLAASTNRAIYADPATNTTESTITNSVSDEFKLSLIDRAVARAKRASPLIRPVKLKGKDYYVCFLDVEQVRQLRTSTDTMNWADIQKAALMGGDITSNPIFTGALGVYNGVVLHETTRLPTFTTVGGNRGARAVFCGAQSAMIGFGKGDNEDTMNWREETFDYGNQLGVGVGLIWGLKKTRFNSEDFGTITISTIATSA